MAQNKREGKGQKAPKKGAPQDKDDSDVDERGNIRGLIDYDYESDSDDHSELSLTASERRTLKKTGRIPERYKNLIRRPRQAALDAKEKIRRRLKKETRKTDSSDSTYRESEDTEEEESPKPKKSKGRGGLKFGSKKSKSRRVVESEEEEDDEDEDDGETLGSQDTEETYDEEEEEEDEEEEDEEEEEGGGFPGISISFSGMGDAEERMVPKRHNLKKESEEVRKFVKLVSKPVEENTIDDQIDQFKGLEDHKQKALLQALELRSDHVKKEEPLMFKLLQMKLNPDTMAMVMTKYHTLANLDPSTGEYYKLRAWMEKLASMPLGIYKEMPVRIDEGSEVCTGFMEKARRYLDEAIWGQDEAKLQIMQFIASKIANPTASGLSLLLIGPPGIGKTSLIKNGIAKALNWPFQFISLGGDSDATTYTGHQFVYEGSHCGKIANCLANAKSMSMVLMFDELDKISTTAKGEEVQNLLVHMTDPVQNMDFEDKYLSGIPLDMSRSMLVFSGNDINKIDRILLDRMVVVSLSSYEKKDKLSIAEKFLLPQALKEVNLMEKVAISQEVIQYILDHYANEETGVRELKRSIEQIVQRINMLRMFNVKELPFHIPNFTLPFVLKKEHVDIFLKKKELGNKPPMGMYV
jgi:hypothetical protein